MGKHYNDLSRRALIKLGNDFDQEHDAELLQYLTEHGDEYENIRPVEKVIEKADHLKEVAGVSTSVVKKVLANEADRMIDAVIESLTDTADALLKGGK